MVLKELSERLDLKRRYPDYFNVWVFRACHILILFYVILVLQVDGLGVVTGDNIYVECPADAFSGKCQNPFYEGDVPFYVPSGNPLYDKPFLLAGESIGDKPSALSRYGGAVIIFLFLVPFPINHWLYLRRKEQ